MTHYCTHTIIHTWCYPRCRTKERKKERKKDTWGNGKMRHVYWHYYTICTCITNKYRKKNMWWSQFKSYNVSVYILKYVHIHDDLKN